MEKERGWCWGRVREEGCWQRAEGWGGVGGRVEECVWRGGGVCVGGAALAFHNSVRLCRCAWQPLQPHSDILLTIHLPLVFFPSHSDSVSLRYLSHLLPLFFADHIFLLTSPSIFLSLSPFVYLSLSFFFFLLLVSSSRKRLSYSQAGIYQSISYSQWSVLQLSPLIFSFRKSNALWFITGAILYSKSRLHINWNGNVCNMKGHWL